MTHTFGVVQSLQDIASEGVCFTGSAYTARGMASQAPHPIPRVLCYACRSPLGKAQNILLGLEYSCGDTLEGTNNLNIAKACIPIGVSASWRKQFGDP